MLQGRARLEAYEEKIDQAIADRIEASDRTEAPQPRPAPEDKEVAPDARESFVPEPEASQSAPSTMHRGARPGPPSEHDSDGYPEEDPDAGIEEENNNSDMDMGTVQECDFEDRVVGIVHEDFEDAVSSILLSQMGQSSRSYRREHAQGQAPRLRDLFAAANK